MRSYSVQSRCRAALLLAVLVVGCAPRGRTPRPITDHRAYLIAEAPEQFDLSAVAGRRIVLDPGHGGPWPGAVGPNGVREADVNLGVALHLWGLLMEAGADVTLTRTVDGRVSDLPDATLKQDLQARAELTNTLDPDIFVSLHHNADIIPGSKKNDLETYYQLRGGPPSLDLAQAVHRHLARNLGQRNNAVRPGNFHVIRETAVPGILGEASYVSSEENELHLAFAAMQRLEAEAYFLGIVEYFSRGVPRVVGVEPQGPDPLERVEQLWATFALDRDVPIDPSTVEVQLNGVRIPARYEGATRTAVAPLSQPLPSGVHTVRVLARNIRGNATRPFVGTFTVQSPPAFVHVEVTPSAVHPTQDGLAVVTAHVLDARGLPVLDGTPVTFEAARGALDRREATTQRGTVNALWYGGPELAGETLLTVRCGELSGDAFVRGDVTAPPTRALQLMNAETDAPLSTGDVYCDGAGVGVNTDGIVIASGQVGSTCTAVAAGFWPYREEVGAAPDGQPSPLRLIPVAGGVLHGQVIAIDAADGGAEPGAMGPTGVRGADVNLRISRYLADYVQTAGGIPVLTRAGDATTSAFTRVESSEAAGASRFLSIRCGAAGMPERTLDASGYATAADLSRGLVIEHYPNSVGGKRLAAFLRDTLADAVPGRPPRVVQSVAYELTHTACPAVRVQPLSPLAPESELLLSEPAMQRRIAFALFQALVQDFGARPADYAGVRGSVTDSAGNAVVGAAVTVNGLWLQQTDEAGAFAFSLLPPGTTHVAVDGVGEAEVHERVAIAPGETARIRLTVPAGAAGRGEAMAP